MFKIGIMGLKPRQSSSIDLTAFPHLSVAFYDERSYSRAAVTKFVGNYDKVIVLQRNVPGPTTSYVPNEKLSIITGSVSSVVRELETIEQAQAASDTPAQKEENKPKFKIPKDWSAPSPEVLAMSVEEEVAKPEPEPVAEVAAAPEKKIQRVALAMDLPEGYRSQYSLPEVDCDVVVNFPNSNGVQSYMLLMAAEPGDVLRFARPADTSLTVWRQRINSVRWRYQKIHGKLLEAHYYQDYVDLQVMRKEEVPTNTLNVKAEVTKVEAELFPSADMGSTVVVVTDSEHGFTAVTADVAEVPNGMSAAEMDFAEEDETPAEVQQTTSELDWVVRGNHPPRVNAGAHFTGFGDSLYPAGMTAPVETSPRLKPPVNVESVELTHQQLVEAAERTFMDTTEPAAVVEAPSPEAKTVSTVPERLFWRKVFFHFLNNGMTATHAANQADTALERHRKTL
jgi:hypothetical protein